MASVYLLINIIFLGFLVNSTFQKNQTSKITSKLLNYIDPNNFTVRFYVYTIKNSKSFDLKSNPDSISTICDSSKPFYKFIVHGFAEAWNMSFRWNWVDDIKREMLKSSDKDKLCIIAVDWEDLARGGKIIANYWSAIGNMKICADIMANYVKKSKMNEKNFHCIGFSLGAHMCSIFYKTYFNSFKVKPARLTALDPAGPFFASKPTTEKLHHTDAEFVDIIHTSDRLGLIEKNGHMDFFPDLGPSSLNACNDLKHRFDNQEKVILFEEANNKDSTSYENITLNSTDTFGDIGGFNKISLTYLTNKFKTIYGKVMNLFGHKPKRIFTSLHQFVGCSHLMSVRYFIYSINDCDFRAYMCKNASAFLANNCSKSNEKDFPRMGYHADKSNKVYKNSFGDFFLNTTADPPYCDVTKNVKKESKGFFSWLLDKIGK